MAWRYCGLAAGLLLMGALPASAEGCDPVTAAQLKQFHTPLHSKSVMHHNDSPDLIIEGINLADTKYMKMSGVIETDWTATPRDADKEEAEFRHVAKSQKKSQSCSIERSEAIDGDMADVYVTQDNETDAITSRTWISRALGLPLRIETYLDQKSDRPATNTSDYDYKDVHAPAVAPAD